MQVVWLESAERDLDEAFDYLLERNPAAALRTYEAVHDQLALLADQPGLGRPGRVTGTRELVIVSTPYLLAYTVDRRADAVIGLRMLHGARLWPEEL